MDGRAFPVGNVLIFFCRTAGLLCLPCGKCFLVLLIVEAFQNRRIETSGQLLDNFIRELRIPSVEKAGVHLWRPENLQAGTQTYPPDLLTAFPGGRLVSMESTGPLFSVVPFAKPGPFRAPRFHVTLNF